MNLQQIANHNAFDGLFNELVPPKNYIDDGLDFSIDVKHKDFRGTGHWVNYLTKKYDIKQY